MTGVLVIVPCGQKKIWDCHANTGQTAARDAYTGAPFRINRAYAEVFSNAWIILSAKYGFIEPGFGISGPYNITLKKKVQCQSQHKNFLSKFDLITSLGLQRSLV